MLSKRLNAVASFINANDKVIDIGCDHGYLGIYLVKNNLVMDILLTDVRSSALNNAILNIQKNNLEIKTKLTNGLENINIIDYNTIVISGMGTKTIKEIFNHKNIDSINKIIIQSNNNLDELRKFMINNGYYIKDEITLFENNIWYVVINFEKGINHLEDNYINFGIPKKDKINYYNYLIKSYNNIYQNIPKKNKNSSIILNKINILKKLLEEC